MALPTWPMISGSLAGPNTIKARTTIKMISNGPMPRTFIAARLCSPNLASVDYKALGRTQELANVRFVGHVGAGDPYLTLVSWLGLGDALQDVGASLWSELREHVVEQDDRQLADLRAHPVRLSQLQGQDGQPLLTSRAVGVQVDAVEDEGEVVAVRTDQADRLVHLPRRQVHLALAKALDQVSRIDSGVAYRGPIHDLQCLGRARQVAKDRCKARVDVAQHAQS